MKIEGYFSSMKNANETAAKLKDKGFDKVFVDMNDHYIENRNVEINVPGTETAASLTGLVMESDAQGIGMRKGPLAAASPMVSGMGGFEEIADVSCKVVVEADESSKDRVKQVIREMGGELDSPHVERPRIKDDRDLAIYDALEEIRKNKDY